MIRDLNTHKQQAIHQIVHVDDKVVDYLLLKADVFVRYRTCIVIMEQYYENAFTNFMATLQITLTQSRQVPEGEIDSQHVTDILTNMQIFVKSFKDKYHSIIEVYFPASDNNF